MKISARVHNSHAQHHVTLTTDAKAHSIVIAPKAEGNGSSTNGGEFLLLALATCYCNDIYREAVKRGIKVTQVEVEAEGEFLAEGAPATRVTYRAKISAHASEAAIRELMLYTDKVAEIQNTLRASTPVTLSDFKAIPSTDSF